MNSVQFFFLQFNFPPRSVASLPRLGGILSDGEDCLRLISRSGEYSATGHSFAVQSRAAAGSNKLPGSNGSSGTELRQGLGEVGDTSRRQPLHLSLSRRTPPPNETPQTQRYSPHGIWNFCLSHRRVHKTRSRFSNTWTGNPAHRIRGPSTPENSFRPDRQTEDACMTVAQSTAISQYLANC